MLVLLVGVGGWYYLDKYEENVIIDILASREEELALPVYAQFVAAQRIILTNRATVTRFVIPVYFPDNMHSLRIDLLSDGKLVRRWRRGSETGGQEELDLVLEPPAVLAGELSVRFSATNIGHEEAGMAPRLFVETADEQYPEGNYKIADNEKEGDISLKIIERRRTLDRYVSAGRRRPLKLAYEAGLGVLLLLLAVSLPGVLLCALSGGGEKEVVKQNTQNNTKERGPDKKDKE